MRDLDQESPPKLWVYSGSQGDRSAFENVPGLQGVLERPFTREAVASIFRSASASEPEQVDLSLGFLDGTVRLIAETSSGQVVLGPDDTLYEVAVEAVFVRSALGPAVAELEALISEPGVPEADLQSFFAEYQEFITGVDYVEAVPHVHLELDSGMVRIPDFVLRSAGPDTGDLLEIKRPDAKVVITKNGRPQLSADVQGGLTQLREYDEVLNSSAVRARVQARYGLELVKPRLRLLIGCVSGDGAAELRSLARHVAEDILTYDHVLERARLRFR
ncbi:MAG: DUF4263 domain-containing protein [Actinomycetia bacterium]|nr:DUF4263 domain-containing protein [Actinomycetes bacterium]